MPPKRVFISFDFDHDQDLRTLLVGQAKHPDTPFEICDWSLKEPLTGDWQEKIKRRIRSTDLTIVLCGEHTNRASGVSKELQITRDEGHPYFLLAGRKDRTCTRPETANPYEKMYNWTWDNLRALIAGVR